MRAPGRGRILVGLVLVAPLLGPAQVLATAPPATITADMPSAVPAGHNWGFNDFFPRALSVSSGATIQFAIEGFHTATLLPAGVTAAADDLVAGLLTSDTDDVGTNPNGTSHSEFSIPATLPHPFGCGTAPQPPCTFDGTSVVSSGVGFGPPAGPFVVHVTASPGAYTFHCRVHPGMEGRLNVLPAAAQGTTPAQLAAAVSTQVAADVHAGRVAEAQARAVSPRIHANGTITWTMHAGASSPDGHTVILEMLPFNLHIRRGDSVRWLSRTPNEPHTVTFPHELFSDIVALCEGTPDTPAIPLHNPPASPADFTCGGRPFPDEVELGGGNGVNTVTSPSTVSDSGIVSSAAFLEAFGVPTTASLRTWTVHFTGARAGVYTYLCQIHPGMEGKVTVVPRS
jgi:plastocyanin